MSLRKSEALLTFLWLFHDSHYLEIGLKSPNNMSIPIEGWRHRCMHLWCSSHLDSPPPPLATVAIHTLNCISRALILGLQASTLAVQVYSSPCLVIVAAWNTWISMLKSATTEFTHLSTKLLYVLLGLELLDPLVYVVNPTCKGRYRGVISTGLSSVKPIKSFFLSFSFLPCFHCQRKPHLPLTWSLPNLGFDTNCHRMILAQPRISYSVANYPSPCHVC